MDPAEDLLRRLALNDENVLGDVMARQVPADRRTELGSRVELLVALGALLAVGAPTPSLRDAVQKASTAGVTAHEIVGVLVCVGPMIGVAGIVATAPKLAMAIGYDLENGHDEAPELGPTEVQPLANDSPPDDAPIRRG